MIDLLNTKWLAISVGRNGRRHSAGVYIYGPKHVRQGSDFYPRNEMEISVPLQEAPAWKSSRIKWGVPNLIFTGRAG